MCDNMNQKIKKFFLKVLIVVFASIHAFIARSLWGNSLNLGELESGSKKVLKNVGENIKTNVANADVVPSCASCGDGGDGGDDAGDDDDDSDDG